MNGTGSEYVGLPCLVLVNFVKTRRCYAIEEASISPGPSLPRILQSCMKFRFIETGVSTLLDRIGSI